MAKKSPVKIRKKKLEKKITETPGDSSDIQGAATGVTEEKKIKEIHEDESDLEKEVEEDSEKKDFSNFTFAINPNAEEWSTGGLKVDLDAIRRAADIQEVRRETRAEAQRTEQIEERPRYQPVTTQTYAEPLNLQPSPRRRDYNPSLRVEPPINTQVVTQPTQLFRADNLSRQDELQRRTEISREREIDEEQRKYYLEKEKQKRKW